MFRRIGFLGLLAVAVVIAIIATSAIVPSASTSARTSASRAERSEDSSVREGSQQVRATSPSPNGGRPLGVLLYTNTAGERCMALGEVQGDRVGATAGDDFKELPLDRGGVCGINPQPLAVSVDRARRGGGSTTIWGVARSDVERIDVALGRGHGSQVIQPDQSGAFIATLGRQVTEGLTITAQTAGAEESITVPALPTLEDIEPPSMNAKPKPHTRD